jgi:hypothetical protein
MNEYSYYKSNQQKLIIMKHELTHEFKAPTERRDDILFRLKNSGIFHRTTIFPNETTPTTPAIYVEQSYDNMDKKYFIVIPLNCVDKFCDEIRAFAAEMKRL